MDSSIVAGGEKSKPCVPPGIERMKVKVRRRLVRVKVGQGTVSVNDNASGVFTLMPLCLYIQKCRDNLESIRKT